MKTKLYLLSFLCLASSCYHEEFKDSTGDSDKGIRFMTAEYEAVMTRSQEDTNKTRRLFLGIADKDSLFLTASETDIGPLDAVMTKSGETVPSSFHINAYRDNEANAYLNLKLTSTDNWATYSPTLYWPYKYEHIHFFAYSYNLGDNLISPQFNTSGTFTAEFDYTIPYSYTSDDDAEVQPDISFAISPSQHENNEPVSLKFVHALAAIEFKMGAFGDAEIVSSSAQLSDILSEGHCTITYPVSPESVKWTTTGNRDSYSQTVKDGVPFMIIPQDLTDTEVTFNISVTIGDITHEFPSKRISDITPEWKANRKYVYTITKGGEVKVDVRDNNTSTVKNNVKIQNSGFTTSYIRAAIVGYWYVIKDGVEEIAAVWDINDSEAGTLTKAADWDSHWILSDGFYYHIDPVEPGGYTAPLFDSYELIKATGPVSGSKLNISIAVQAVEQNAAESLWGDALRGNN